MSKDGECAHVNVCVCYVSVCARKHQNTNYLLTDSVSGPYFCMLVLFRVSVCMYGGECVFVFVTGCARTNRPTAISQSKAKRVQEYVVAGRCLLMLVGVGV